MPHPIYGPTEPRLTAVRLVLTLPTNANDRSSRLDVYGECSTQRGTLWHVQERWNAAEHRAGLEPTDAAHHALLVAMQDRPRSQAEVERALSGGALWYDEPLPFD